MVRPLDVSDLPIIGVASIDAQHRGLMELFVRLDAGIRAGEGREILGPLMDGLAAAAADHCAHEEDLLARAGYAGLHDQRTRHQGFIRKLGEMAEVYRSGGTVLGPEVSRFLATWIADHIRREDAAYIPCLRAAGLTGS